MKALKFLGYAIVCYSISYLMVSFYWLSFDVLSWPAIGRFILMWVGTISWVAAAGISEMSS
jgi:hypothetical protein